MRDGVELLADHYEPMTATPAGTLLVHCPFGRGFPFSTLYASLYAAHGCHVVFQSVVAFGSEGDFEPMINEKTDGADPVEWLRHRVLHGVVRHHRPVVSRLRPVGLLADPPAEMKAADHHGGVHDPSGPVGVLARSG